METNIFQLMSNELAERSILYYEKFCPMYIISIGSHLFNIHNKRKDVYYIQAVLVDTRIHVFLVCPSGFGKTFHLRQFIDPKTGLIKGCLPCAFEGPMTEAAWTGTGTLIDGEPIILYGAAHEYKTSIVGVEEFSSITQMMQSATSKTLHPQLLTSLESGKVRKRLRGNIKIHYDTGVSLWAGDRPATFNLASGMGRRLTFMNFFPTQDDIATMRDLIFEGENIKPNAIRLKEIHEALKHKVNQIDKIRYVTTAPDVRAFLKEKVKAMPYELVMYLRMLLGYHIMCKPIKPDMYLHLDKTITSLMYREKAWRDQIRRGADVTQVFVIMKDHGHLMPKRELLDRLSEFGLNYFEGSTLVETMIKRRMLQNDKKGHVKTFYRKKGGGKK